MKLTLLLEKGEWKLRSSGDIKKNESKVRRGSTNGRGRGLIFTCILVRKRKKKKGDSTSQLELGVGPVGIMHAGTWEFEVS